MTPTSVRRATALLVVALTLTGCATPQNRDPLEPLNRKVFVFNDNVDRAVLRPVARVYRDVVPQPVQTGVGNFVSNIKDVWSAINLALQGRAGDAAQEVLRVGLNSTLGLGGLIDIATPMALERHNEDFGQTLGVWGVPAGAYLMLPLLGPSTTRDAMNLPGEMYFSASRLFQEPREANWFRAVSIVNARARALGATDLLGDVALDPYTFVRDAYLQRRESLIRDGDVPYENGEDEEAADAPQDVPDGMAPAGEAAQGEQNPGAARPGASLWQQPLLVPHALTARMQGDPAEESGLPSWFQQSLVQMAVRAPHAGAVQPADVMSGMPGHEAGVPSHDELAGLREADLPR